LRLITALDGEFERSGIVGFPAEGLAVNRRSRDAAANGPYSNEVMRVGEVYPMVHKPEHDPEAAIDGNHHLPIDPDVQVESAEKTQAHTPERHRHERVLAAIAIGGFLGGVARYEIGLAFPTAHGTFPATTFTVNVAGSFILALLTVFVLEILPPTVYVRPLLGVGFCGALTTFSTWMLDTDRLLGAHDYGAAAGDVLGSLAAGLAATSLGLTVGRAIVAHRERKLAEELEGAQEHQLVPAQGGSR